MDAISAHGSTGALSSSVDSMTGNTMHHSLSTPAGVDVGARTPPATPKKGGKMLAIRVQMLDDTVTIFQVQAKAMGKVLFDQVCKQLHLLEADYFGLEYSDTNGTKYWLDLQKPMSRQLGLSLVDPFFHFCVKFYTPDPAQLEEEYTRYLFCLQVKRDLAQGIMQCNENTSAVMASYIVQAECGDYVPEDYPDHTYLSSYKFVPQQDREMEKKIMENHKKHTGQSPAEADLNLLETARRCELYGVKMHPAKDQENVPLNLAVAHMGIIVFQNYTKINTFSWAKIRKISFKRKRFLIKLHPENVGHYKDTVEFFFEGRNECKNFWKKCVENHGFFRCSSVKTVSRHKTRVLSRGSSFRYSGKTQKQIVEFVRDNYVKRQTFQRSHSFRHSSAHSSASNMHTSAVGNSISAHPLLPLADSNLSVEASKLSASLGSMGPDAVTGARRPASPTMKSASHPLGTATSWSSAPDNSSTSPPITKTITMVPRPPVFIPTMNSPSPTETRSASDEESSGTVSPLTSPPHQVTTTAVTVNRKPVSPPLAVRAAVHRADTGITMLTNITTRTPSSYKSEGSLDHPHTPVPPFSNNYCPSQTQSQNDIGPLYEPVPSNAMDYSNETTNVPIKRKLWQRSASCKDLYDFSFEETGKAKRRAKSPRPLEKAVVSLDERKQDSPITVYDDHRALYSTSSRDSSLEIQQDIMVPSQKLFLNSFPGSGSYSQESVEDPGNYDLRDSQEDVSHDSYELIEKSDESTSGDYKNKKPKQPLNTRSCSLDSGNYLPSDSESDHGGHQKYRSISNQDICLVEDPRDFPREIIPRKSDGSFYKALKQNSRTSSLESRSDYYETRTIRSNRSRGIGSRTSSQESRSDYESRRALKKNRSADNLEKYNHYYESRASSVESKSEYFDALSKHDDSRYKRGDYDRKINFERNYGTQKPRHIQSPEAILSVYSDAKMHSINLQNVETEQSKRVDRILSEIEHNSLPIAMQSHFTSPDMPKSIHAWQEKCVTTTNGQISTESDSNVFSFDEVKIQSIQESSDLSDIGFGIVPNIELPPKKKNGKNYRDIFMEIEPRICHDLTLHQPIERTKSDPNSLARQKIHPNPRRLLLMHQKSIDLTPAESSDDDYLYKQIPSAPPITKFKGTHFEMPTAEFGHFDILKREIEGQKTKFEVPKSQFEILGVKNQSDFMNLPPKGDEIPYVLHKRHVMNGTAKRDELTSEEEFGDFPIKEKIKHETIIEIENKPSSFLFTQNIDLSKVNPITLEVDKSIPPIHHISSPKRDITHIDPVMLETLNSKLSQIESDSPTSSKAESLKPLSKPLVLQPIEKLTKIETKIEEKPPRKSETSKSVPDVSKSKTISEKIKTDIKPKRVIKPRMQPGKKGNKTTKTKFRITSFSSDDESLDSDDVFGSAEATPTRIEFSPPQMRKEMESILKFESERKYLQYTMSSTEVEGSPPTTRKKPKEAQEELLELNAQQTELRRISERSLSIPSSEDEFNIKTVDMTSVFIEPPDILKEVEEIDREEAEKSLDETLREDQATDNELTTIEDERKREKALLQAEIENDLKDLKVPPRTKITEIVSSSARSKGPSPLLFAHARLNLSEGSAFSLIQKQQAMESPLPGRRARSLDAPVVPVNKLPPINAFSSKDDTVEEEQHTDKDSGLENNLVSDKSIESDTAEIEKDEKPKSFDNGVVPDQIHHHVTESQETLSTNIKEWDQIVPDLISNKKALPRTSSNKATPTLPPKGVVPPKPPKDSIGKKPVKVVKEKPKLSGQGPTKYPPKPRSLESKSLSREDSKPPLGLKASSIESKSTISKSSPDSKMSSKQDARINGHKMLTQKAASAESAVKPETSQSSLTLPEIKRTKSQEMEPTKKTIPKEKAKSLEKLELRRMGSKERQRSQEDSEEVIAERRKIQQMLYETAIKQTKTLKSPVKDVLPVFPQVEETVRERGGKLEISINTIEPNVSLEEAIIVTKSPKKLDKKLDKKLTKSLELNLADVPSTAEKTLQRMGKSLDLERSKSEDEADKSTEFDFKPATIKSIHEKDKRESPEFHNGAQQIVTVDVHSENSPAEEKVILEGTSLDMWLSISDKRKERLKDIKVIKDGNDFFEKSTSPKPPDLSKMDGKSKSSSDSTSIEKLSLGNSLDIKYIDESAESSSRSDKDRQIISELQKASDTVNKFLKRKLERRRKDIAANESAHKISEIRLQEADANQLTVTITGHKDDSYKLGVEESKDEIVEVTVDKNSLSKTDENETKELIHPADDDTKISEKDLTLLGADAKQAKLKLLKKGSDHSKSSDTGSWTSGEKELSPGNNVKETDESSISCSMGRTIGLSQNIETFANKDQLDKGSSHSSEEQPKSPRSPRICVLGRAFTIDEDSQKLEVDNNSSSDEANDIPKDLTPIQEAVHRNYTESDDDKVKKAPYPFEQKWSQDSELSQKLHKKICKKISSADKSSFSSLDDSVSIAKRNILEKPNLLSVEKLSTESRNSLDTESSSGSLGAAARMQKSGDIPKELSSTWKPFPLDSSGSESFDDNLLPPDQEYFLCRDDGDGEFTTVADIYYKSDDLTCNARDDTELPEDLANFSSNFGYPCLTSLSGIGGTDVFAGYSGGTFLSRTLSRISERSTNSEKSSLDDDVTKASTQSDSLNDESVVSSNPQVSISSESPSHAHVYDNEKKTPTNEKPSSNNNSKENKDFSKHSDKHSTDPVPNINSLLQRQISDDRRTSAEMAELSMDDIEIITSERGLRLKRQGSDDTIIDEECLEETPYIEKQSSQESDDWPLPEIPNQSQKPLLAMHEAASTDTSQLTTQIYQAPSKSIPKTFGLRSSIKSQDSEQWPSPPSSIMEQPIIENVVETYYVSPPEQAYRVTVESSTTTHSTYDDSNSDDYKTVDLETEGFHTYENVMPVEYENVIVTEHVSESLSESQSLSVGPTGIKIVLEGRSQDSNSDDDLNISNLNDDVFMDSSEMISRSEQLRPPTALRRNDDSKSEKRGSQKSSPAGSHSSYSEEECTSSLATNLEDGTVRFALKPTKCTHSSHSEDTSIALSLSEWSNSTNTVKFQNLSSNSGTTKSSSGLKSDENSLTDIAQSISEWSSTNSSTLKIQQQSGGSHPFQKLSSGTSTGDSSTLTEFIAPSISDWSTSETAKSLVTQQFFPGSSVAEITPPRLGSSVDMDEIVHEQKSPKNIPSEDFSLFSSSSLGTHTDPSKFFTKSTERPILIPCVQIPSDTEKSSSSIEQKTVHIQRCDKDKKGYLQKYHSQLKSTDRPIKVNLKLAKCSPYYSSSLSSESTPLGGTSPVPPVNKTATVPLTRIHRKPISRNLVHAKSPTSENDSTSSVESPKSKSERERRGYRRKRQLQNQRNKLKNEKDHHVQQQQQQQHCTDEFYYVENDHGLTEYNEYIRERNMEEMASNFQYESVLAQDSPVLHFVNENVEEGYYPDGDSQSGSDIFRMERDDDDNRYEFNDGSGGGFDVSSIPPPLLEDDFENDSTQHI